MDTLDANEREELQHFINIVYAFMSYKRDGSVDVERMYRSFNLLSEDDKKLLVESPAARTIKILKALITNQNFIISVLSGIIAFEHYDGKLDKLYLDNETRFSETEVMAELRKVVRNTSFCNVPEGVADAELNPSRDAVVLQRNINWVRAADAQVRTTLRQFVRDWSAEGEAERNQCFVPLLDALRRRVPIADPKNPPV